MNADWKDLAAYVVRLERETIRLRDILKEILKEFDNVYVVDIDNRGIGHANIDYQLARLISGKARSAIAKAESLSMSMSDNRKDDDAAAKTREGCRRRLARGQWWAFCGETDMGQTMPALCTECGGKFELSKESRTLAKIVSTTEPTK